MAKDAGFTPVIFPLERDIPFAPSININLSSRKGSKGFSYMERLQQRHKAMTRIETWPLLPNDQNQEIDNKRVDSLRQRVHEAWLNTDGNPADGKYTFLTRLLRLESTSGINGHWSGVRTDLPPAEQLPGARWINAKTEAEWKEWERKYEAERRIKDKVEKWKKTVEAPSTQSSFQESLKVKAVPGRKALGRSGSKVSSTNSLSVVVDPLKSSTPFGFSVVKRTQKTAVGKPSGSGSGKAKVPSEKPSANDTSLPAKSSHNKHISDLPEQSFIPPSFPASQLLTSTPKHAAKPFSKPRKPEPIPHLAPPSTSETSILPEIPSQIHQPLLSPRVTKTYGRHNPSPSQSLEASVSLPAIPLTPSTPSRTRNRHKDNDDPFEDDSIFNTNNKRLLSPPVTPKSNSKERALKRARTLSEFQHPRELPLPSDRSPSYNRNQRTPTKLNHIVPSVTAVAAAAMAASDSAPAPPGAFPSSSLTRLPSSSPSPKKSATHAVPTLIDLLASAKKGKKKLLETSGTVKPSSKGNKDKGKNKESSPPTAENAEQQHQQAMANVDSVQQKLPVAPFLFPEAVVEDGPTTAVAKDADEQESVHANFHDLSDREKDPQPFDPYASSFAMAYDDPSLIPIDAMSPAKSLSSLAGSDSEEDEIENDDDGKSIGLSFNALATSTQHRGPFGNTGGTNDLSAAKESQPAPNFTQMTKDSWESIYAPTSMPKSKSKSASAKSKSPAPPPQPRHYQMPNTDLVPNPSSNPFAYSSQFAMGVAKSVYDVDRLLEQDVEYSGWIRDPYADEIEDADGFKEPESSP